MGGGIDLVQLCALGNDLAVIDLKYLLICLKDSEVLSITIALSNSPIPVC